MSFNSNDPYDDSFIRGCVALILLALISAGILGAVFFAIVLILGVIFLLARWVILLLRLTHKINRSWINVGLFFLFLPVFVPFWLIDRWAIHKRAIHIRCPNCKVSDIRHSIRPIFLCPVCGERHDNLIPSPRGLFKRRCGGTIQVKIQDDVAPKEIVVTVNADGSVFDSRGPENDAGSFKRVECPAKLATTFLGGRSKYEARCPKCDALLYSTGARQYGIQLVGGTGSGKTTFLATFWERYKALLERKDIAFKALPRDAFEKLEALSQNDNVEPTEETNSHMLSVVHEFWDESVQASFYDLSGKYFETGQSETPQLQFGYCEGFLLFIDPTASPDVALETTINFIDTFNAMTGKHPSRLSDVPVAVIIPKVDLDPFNKAFGAIKLHAATLRDQTCRSFLAKRGFAGIINIIDANFSNVGFFPVISTVSDEKHAAWKSFGVLEAVSWLMSDERSPFCYSERYVFLNTRFNMFEKV